MNASVRTRFLKINSKRTRGKNLVKPTLENLGELLYAISLLDYEDAYIEFDESKLSLLYQYMYIHKNRKELTGEKIKLRNETNDEQADLKFSARTKIQQALHEALLSPEIQDVIKRKMRRLLYEEYCEKVEVIKSLFHNPDFREYLYSDEDLPEPSVPVVLEEWE